jgi:sugar/nucleoside kinase (ribokinase family)
MSVLVVGSVALDTVKTATGKVDDALGGSASYFSVAARHFTPVSMVAVVGEDFPERYLDLFRGKGIGVVKSPGRTFRWSGEYAADFSTRRTLDTQLNVFAGFDPRLSPDHRKAPFVFLANIHPKLQASVLDQVADPQLVVLDTMNYWIEGERPALLEVLKRVDVVLLNDEEAKLLVGERGLLAAARTILRMGPSLAVIKKGEHGVLVISPRFTFAVPAFPLEAVADPTGAGDTFAGGFLGKLASLDDPRSEAATRLAVAYGTVLASYAVESFSLDRLAAVGPTEVESRLASLRRLVSF